MSAIKHHYHDQTEQGMRLFTGQELRQLEFMHNRNREAGKLPKYDMLELTGKTMAELIEIASALGLVVGDAVGRQNMMNKILEKQTEITPALKGDCQGMICETKAPFRAGGEELDEL